MSDVPTSGRPAPESAPPRPANPVVTPIHVAFGGTHAAARSLRLRVGACRLRVRPAAPGSDGDAWVTGTYTDPSGALPAVVTQQDDAVVISQQTVYSEVLKLIGKPPRFDLYLGTGAPYTLVIDTGASEIDLDLGGLPLTAFTLRQGAGEAQVDFSAPNPGEMDALRVEVGAVDFEMERLANANFATMVVSGGAAEIDLDFRGTLRRAADVRVGAGLAGVEIVVPQETPVRVLTDTVLGEVNVSKDFVQQDGAYWNQAALAGQATGAPLLTLSAKAALSGISIKSR